MMTFREKQSVSGFVEAPVHQLFPCLAFYKQSYAVFLFFL